MLCQPAGILLIFSHQLVTWNVKVSSINMERQTRQKYDCRLPIVDLRFDWRCSIRLSITDCRSSIRLAICDSIVDLRFDCRLPIVDLRFDCRRRSMIAR